MTDFCSGQDFQKQHQSVTNEYGGPKPSLSLPANLPERACLPSGKDANFVELLIVVLSAQHGALSVIRVGRKSTLLERVCLRRGRQKARLPLIL